MHQITVVNKKTFKGRSEYIGRAMRNLQGSPLGNPYRVKPFGPYERDESVLVLYRRWLWDQMKDTTGDPYRELQRLRTLAQKEPISISCWCVPDRCHGEIVKAAIEFMNKVGAAT